MPPFVRHWLLIVSISAGTNCWAELPSVNGWWHAKPEGDYFEKLIFVTTSGENICATWRVYPSEPDGGVTVYLGHFSSGRGVLVKAEFSGITSLPDIVTSQRSVLTRYPIPDQKEIFMGTTKLIVRERFQWSSRHDYVLYSPNSSDFKPVPSANLDKKLCAEAMKIGQ